MKTLPLLLAVIVAILAAFAAEKASFPIKRSNNSSTLSDLKLLTSQTILPSYSGVFYAQLGIMAWALRLFRPQWLSVSPITWLQIL
ncbi:hypothetical protein M0R45_029419 [Rubus argutus]|uniref:Uncharacterized protein n=1 Tax=Rubus argutus TaxID=59490 RepID=A0AAW1W7R2_RUBAR